MIRVFDDAAGVARAAAEHVVAAAGDAIGKTGRFTIALSGGRTPQGLYRTLAAEPARGRIDWGRVQIYFADERAVPPAHADSNFRLARETLIDSIGIPPTHVHRMKGEYPDLTVAAEEYEAHLTRALDLIVLGMGEDGHTASIFPGSPVAGEYARRIAVVEDSPKPPPRRLTVTPRVLDEALGVLMLVTGEGKAAAAAAALEGDGSPAELPARLVRGRNWLLDREAASRLLVHGARNQRGNDHHG